MVGTRSPILYMLNHKPIAQVDPDQAKKEFGPIDKDQINELWKPRQHESLIFESAHCSYEYSVNKDDRLHRHGKVEDGECQVYEYVDDNPWGCTRRVVFRSSNDAASCQSFCNHTLRTSPLVWKQI